MTALWIISRSTGLIAAALLSAAVTLGILTSIDMGSTRWPRFVTQGLHRRIAYLACAILGIHIAAVVADNYVNVDALAVFVPFTSSYERFAVGLGAIAVDLVIIVVATSLLKRHLPHYFWQIVHVSTYALWPLALIHGLLAGSDDLLALGISMIGALSVTSVALWRAFRQVLTTNPAVSSNSRLNVSTANGPVAPTAPQMPVGSYRQ